MTDRALTPKRKAFVAAYAACGNALEAARQAGYKTPHPEGARLLQDPTIQQALKELTAPGENARIATAEERQAFWTAAMRGEIKGSSLKDRLSASELLGRAQADFVDRHKVEGGDQPIKIEFVGL